MNVLSPRNKKSKLFDVASKIVVANENVSDIEKVKQTIQSVYGRTNISNFVNNNHIKKFSPTENYRQMIKNKYNYLKSNDI